MILSGEGISKKYSLEVLNHCSLSVRAGQCVIVSGPSGGGKSTLLRIMALLETADSGTVCHDQRRYDSTREHRGPIYPFLTLVFQRLFLWPNLTMADNLSLVLEGHVGAQPSEQALGLLERLAIREILPRYPHECSVGQQQRLALSRAILSDARFLLLDEPTSALDRVSSKLLAAELAREKATGRGFLIVSHDETTFKDLADERYLLEHGTLTSL
jgi:ABC-type lipoprotein export system ATPase subunit